MAEENRKSVDLKDSFLRYISNICHEIGPRPPCSAAEKKCAERFKNELEPLCHEIHMESFIAHVAAYKAAFRLPMIFYLIAVGFYWFNSWISLILISLSVLILFGEMALAYNIIDFCFPGHQSVNVMGKIHPTESPKILVLFTSHLDTNWEFPLMRKLNFYFGLIVAINFLMNGLFLLFLVIKLALDGLYYSSQFMELSQIFFWIFISATPCILLQLFYLISNRTQMGANDNLSGMAVCKELAKEFGSPSHRLKNVEIWIGAFGCEEIGSRGSQAFARAHRTELKDAKVVNLDILGCKNSPINIGISEAFGMIKLSRKLAKDIAVIAKDQQVTYKLGSEMAFTDALSFSRQKIEATSLTTFPTSGKEFYYHTRYDTPEYLDMNNLVIAYNICREFVLQLDK